MRGTLLRGYLIQKKFTSSGDVGRCSPSGQAAVPQERVGQVRGAPDALDPALGRRRAHSNYSWCREGPRIVLSTGSVAPREAELGRAAPILIARGGPRPCGLISNRGLSAVRFPRSLRTVGGEVIGSGWWAEAGGCGRRPQPRCAPSPDPAVAVLRPAGSAIARNEFHLAGVGQGRQVALGGCPAHPGRRGDLCGR
jgi:hypothetical protein